MMKTAYLLVSCILVFLSCGKLASPLTGGSASEGEAKVTGRVVYAATGDPAADCSVKLRPAAFLKDTSRLPLNRSVVRATDRFTDESGYFAIDSVDTGNFAVEINDRQSYAVLIRFHNTGDSSAISLTIDSLRPTGTIAGTSPSFVSASGNAFVQVYGLDRVAKIDLATGTFTVPDVPAGLYSLHISSSVQFCPPKTIDSIAVVPGDTAVVPFGNWKFSRRIFFNTTSSGAGVTGDVLDFPALIRLTKGNFSFPEAQAGGNDLLITTSGNIPVPFEIERWDPVSGRAEVWVKIDTVHGDDSIQSITMYWGNSDASGGSNGAAVFDTANGFQGVWHLREAGSLASDATGNRYAGTGYFTSPVAGIIGAAQHFNGISSFIQMKGTASGRLNFPMGGHYTVSAWVYHDTLADSVTYLVAGKGELQYFLKSFGLAQSTTQHEHQWEFTEYHGNNIWQAVTQVPAVAKTWTFLAGIRDGANQYLYVNGALVMAGYRVFGTGQDTIARDTSDDFSIGAFLHSVADWHQGYAYFSGAIDEAGVSSVPRSADWIKLCYMNQRIDDKLIVFGK
jgi:hypothetical protein